MIQIRSYLVATLLALSVGAIELSAEPHKASGFSNASLTGTYAAREKGDGSVSAGLGVVCYDGKGNTTRYIIVNAPVEGGGRRTFIFESEGKYTVNPDGTGTATYTNMVSGGTTTITSFDFVITGVTSTWALGRGRAETASSLFVMQREAGLTVSLITGVQTRVADKGTRGVDKKFR